MSFLQIVRYIYARNTVTTNVISIAHIMQDTHRQPLPCCNYECRLCTDNHCLATMNAISIAHIVRDGQNHIYIYNIYIYIYGVCTVRVAGRSPNMLSCTVYIYTYLVLVNPIFNAYSAGYKQTTIALLC